MHAVGEGTTLPTEYPSRVEDAEKQRPSTVCGAPN